MRTGKRSLNDCARETSLARQGSTHFEMNAVAAAVDRVYRRRWRAFLANGKAAALYAGMHAELVAVIETALVDTALESQEAVTQCVRSNVGPLTLLALHGDWADYHAHAGESAAAAVLLAKLRAQSKPKKKPSAAASPRVAKLFAPLTRDQIRDVVHASVAGKRWRDRLENYSGRQAAAIGREIESGLLLGRSVKQVAADILPLVDDDRVAAMTLARTELHRVSVEVQLAAWKRQLGPRAVKEWIYLATLDNRTRKTHAANDKKRFRVGDPPPKTLSEPNCRCALQPAFTRFSNLGLPQSVVRALNGIRGERPAKVFSDGKWRSTVLEGGTTYGQWFDALPKAKQREILGPRLFDQITSGGRRKAKWSTALEASGEKRPRRRAG